MTMTVTPNTDQSNFVKPGPGALTKLLQQKGKLPPVALHITPTNAPGETTRSPQYLDRFLSYQFNSSVLVPVDIFTFTYAAPDSVPIPQTIKVGDIVTLLANNQPMSVGIIDGLEIECDREFGEKVTITGRNLMGQLEDQECVNPQSQMLWASNATMNQVMSYLLANTRIQQYLGTQQQWISQNGPNNAYLFATEPGESKLSALQRYLEPLNCIAWMSPTGQIKVGKPNMTSTPLSSVYINKKAGDANCMDMRVAFTGTQIPGAIVPVIAGTETQQSSLPQAAIANKAQTPARLWSVGHRTTKCVVVSYPNSGSPSEFPTINNVIVSNANPTQFAPSILKASALREMARQNVSEVDASATIPGHYDENANPFLPDNIYRVTYDRAMLDENMYLYEVQYFLDVEGGQRSSLRFCRLNTIVSSQVAP